MPIDMKSFYCIILMAVLLFASACEKNQVPSYLEGYEEAYLENPRQTNLEWFKDAGFGLFIHYGLYAQLGRGEWVMYHDTIPVEEYKELAQTFTAENFDADFITDLAIDAGMEYITITSKHHDGFCLFETDQTGYNSLNTPCGRDLIGELYEACQDKGLGLFLYYSYAADWQYPYFYPHEEGARLARPHYKTKPERYKYETEADFKKYIEYAHNHLKELLTQYPDISGIWFDPIMGYYMNAEAFPIDETYQLVRENSPHALISFKQGASGKEDFIAPERSSYSLVDRVQERGADDYAVKVAKEAWEKNKDKPKEICNTLQPHAWGYNKADDGNHRTVEDVMQMLEDAEEIDANLLLNIGPLPDGSVHPEDIKTLREVGDRLRNQEKSK